ncbi:hypothetical protein ABT294_25875 [Nonomuraea sp. NPDC000554]|uniref:hypothetical protein n=1 Tax=Nonomuraea sp. NPDC000554 TaxID=3154259 RepID=UPI003332F17D
MSADEQAFVLTRSWSHLNLGDADDCATTERPIPYGLLIAIYTVAAHGSRRTRAWASRKRAVWYWTATFPLPVRHGEPAPCDTSPPGSGPPSTPPGACKHASR